MGLGRVSTRPYGGNRCPLAGRVPLLARSVMSATRDASAIVAVRPWPNRAACEPRGEPRAPSRPARPSTGCRGHREGGRAQPRQPHGIPLAHLGRRCRARPETRAHRPRLQQPRPRRGGLWRHRPRRDVGRQRCQRRHRHLLQRHALGARALRALPAGHQGNRPRRRRGRPGGWGRARDVRWHHAGADRHGAQPVQPRRHRDVDRDRPVARRLRRRPDAGCLRQDRPRPGRGCPDLRAPAHRPRAGRSHGLGTFECREGRGAKGVRGRACRSRGAPRLGGRVVPLARAPAPSTGRPTPTSCSWTSWACTCPARPSCTPTTRCGPR